MNALRSMRLKNKWTQKDLCTKAHVSLGTVRGFEEGRTSKFSDKVLFKIADAFGVEPSQMEEDLGTAKDEDNHISAE